MTDAIELRREQAIEAAPNIGQMLQAVIEKGVSGENVKALESLVGLYERMEALNSERAFAQSFNALQSEMPKVQARKPVPNNDGTVRYRFAPYEEIMAQVQPLLLKHGFAVDFSVRYGDGRLISTCRLTHIRGFSRSTEFAVRIGSGPPKASEAQADGAASTYAKRFALCNSLNIVCEQDTDADPRAEGGTITPEQAADLRRRVHETGSDESRFLAFAGASSFEEIRSGKFAMLDQNLRRKEVTK